jgi:PAS domain-containing protein
VQDVQGVVMHEMANVLGMIDVNSDETSHCIMNVPTSGPMNQHPCTYEEQLLLQAYGIRNATLIPSDAYIAKTVTLTASADSAVVGDTLTFSVSAIAGPEPSDTAGATHAVAGLSYSWSSSDAAVVDVPSSSSASVDLVAVGFGTAYVKVQANPAGTVAFPWPRDSVLVTVERASGLDPCFSAEGTSTYRAVDQFLTASSVCGDPGTGYEYRWRFEDGGQWTTWTTERTTEFLGHGSSGEKAVTVAVRDAVTGDTAQDARTFMVGSPTLSVAGPEYVTDKFLKQYTSTEAGDWYERLDPESSSDWGLRLLAASSRYNRIWPAGEYEVALRSTRTVAGQLRRGRRAIQVCWGCGGAAELVALPGGSLPLYMRSAAVLDRWGIFGAGPWITGGAEDAPELARFYDLTGLHEPGSPFADASWLDGEGGRTMDAGGRWEVEWTRLRAPEPGVLGFEFTVRPRTGASYEFGLAVDPDLGSPVDDRSGYDAVRGLVYVLDAGGAVGLLVREAGGDALATVREYGARSFAPRATEEAWRAARDRGVALAPDPDDVQLLLTVEATTGVRTWRLWILRGRDASELAGKADRLLAPE